MRPMIRLMAMPNETHFAPLGVLGYCLTRTPFLWPVLTAVHLPQKAVEHTPASKLLDVVVSILAGCRAIRQVNTRLRPDLALARAWGRPQFADQSTLARTLDSFTFEQIEQLRQASATLLQRESQTLRHSFATDWLWLDLDLTPLPISKHAQDSTKGKISAKKTPMGDSWPVYRRLNIMKRSSHISIPANSRAARPTCPWLRPLRVAWPWVRSRRRARSCGPTQASGTIQTSTRSCRPAGR